MGFQWKNDIGLIILLSIFVLVIFKTAVSAQRTEKPPLHGRHWVAITGKPLAATAGAAMFHNGGNAVDAACAMLGATSTMFDDLSWGGETQALIYNPKTGKVIGINALGVAPTGATPEFFKDKGLPFPPAYGPLAAITPGTPGGLMVMLAEFGKLSLKEVLEPSIQMAEGYPIEKAKALEIQKEAERLKTWPYSHKTFITHPGEDVETPHTGEIFRQPDLYDTLQKLVDAEAEALAQGKSRKEAIYTAYDRFYNGDIAEEFVRGSQEQGGLHTMEDLANWQVYLEEPVSTNYKGIEVYKLTSWVQGPVLLQALNIVENFDIKSMGYNSTRYIHTLYQVMNLVFADRDFYYGDPYFPPEEPLQGLLSKKYAQERSKLINWDKNDPDVRPGDPYPYQGDRNPFLHFLKDQNSTPLETQNNSNATLDRSFEEGFFAGTTSVQAADKEGWVVSITPSGGWIPAVIAGRTGIGMSQRMQSFVLNESQNPFNVLAPGKRPRATLTPSMALKGGKPYLSFAVQGGDTQDQNSLQFFLNFVEFGMSVQEAVEASNITSYQMHSSFDAHDSQPGKLTLNDSFPPWVRSELEDMGYKLDYKRHTSGPLNAIFFDREHGTLWGGSSNHGEDYGIAW
ncbi:MAG: gamma-glutamyltransferase [Deltaproteobacteria bacterium]|nr:gamma-glutamyltransferase [Deltaproteobacteria bacterium]